MDSQLLIRSATNAKYKDRKDEKKFLASITHLSLDKKSIETIENLDLCLSLNVLYLSENRITWIQGLDNLKNLVQLNLDNNHIIKMQGFDCLVNLRKLYLEKNCISKLEGLHSCRRLEELYLQKQTLPQEVEFTFDEYSLAAISMSLKILDLEQCNVVQCSPLYYLEQVVELNLKDNFIGDIDEVAQILRTINFLTTLDLRGNPVVKVMKYRDQVVMLALKLQMLDEKKIMDQERRYLYNLVQQKEMKAQKETQQMKKQYSAAKFEELKAGNATAPNFASSNRLNSHAKPGNMSQQNKNPFGITNRGYKGQLIKANGSKPPINLSGKPTKVMQQAGLSVLGNQMTLGMNYDVHNERQLIDDLQYNQENINNYPGGSREGSSTNKSNQQQPRRGHSVNINSGVDFSLGTTFQNTKHIHKQ